MKMNDLLENSISYGHRNQTRAILIEKNLKWMSKFINQVSNGTDLNCLFETTTENEVKTMEYLLSLTIQ